MDEIRQTDALTVEETQILFGWGENIFGAEPHKLSWRPKDLHFILYADSEPVSHASILKHEVLVDGEPVTVGGVGGLVTVPQGQRKGYANRLVQHATKYLETEWRVDAGFLFCLARLMPYYGRLGWQEVGDQVIIQQPAGEIVSPMCVMVLPFGGREWPAGSIELRSLPW